MKKRTTLFLCLALLAALFGCRPQTEGTRAPAHTAVFTNLTGQRERQTLRTLLQNAAVRDERIDALFNEIDAFNASVPASMLTDGWEPLGAAKYDPYEMQEKYEASNPDFVGYNCRLTAFSILADRIAANGQAKPASASLFMDEEALDENSSAAPSEADRTKFMLLFAELPTEPTTRTEDHVKAVRAAWKERGIAFDANAKAHLITVVFHDQPSETENELFFGHAGVLLEEDGALYFFEKLAFMEPYCLTRFSDRTSLCDYLMQKYDVSYDQPTAAPFVMEDDALLAGYRPNPHKTEA